MFMLGLPARQHGSAAAFMQTPLGYTAHTPAWRCSRWFSLMLLCRCRLMLSRYECPQDDDGGAAGAFFALFKYDHFSLAATQTVVYARMIQTAGMAFCSFQSIPPLTRSAQGKDHAASG